MTDTTISPRPVSRARRPQVVIDAAQLAQLEDLAQGAASRSPDLADTLLTELARAKIVAEGKLPADVVALHRPVTWRDEVSGRVQSATLVMPQEADIDAGRVSVMTPIGVALIGLKVGAQLNWITRGGEERLLSVIAVG